jgi:hypothetical protein
MKADFLYNFLKFVTWPDSGQKNTDDWQIGVIGDEAVIEVMRESFIRKRVDGRNIEVNSVDDKDDVERYHLLFITENYMETAADLVACSKNSPVLLVGEVVDFASNYGIIGFVRREDILRLEINPLRARNAGLIINHKLASLAELVRDNS